MARDIGNILFLRDHCQFEVRFDLAGDKKSKITELQMFSFPKLILQGKYKSFPAGRSGLDDDFKNDFFNIIIIHVYCKKTTRNNNDNDTP